MAEDRDKQERLAIIEKLGKPLGYELANLHKAHMAPYAERQEGNPVDLIEAVVLAHFFALADILTLLPAPMRKSLCDRGLHMALLSAEVMAGKGGSMLDTLIENETDPERIKQLSEMIG